MVKTSPSIAGDRGSIPGREVRASLRAQLLKNPPAMQETLV